MAVLPVREREGLGVGAGVGGGLSPDRMLSAFIAGAYPQCRRSSHVHPSVYMDGIRVIQAHHVAVAKTWGDA